MATTEIDPAHDQADEYEATIAALPEIPLGSRVRLRAWSHALTLRSYVGQVIEPDRWDGYYIVRLDEPAIYDDGVNAPDDLRDIRAFALDFESIG